jgi:hypothetical protein
MLGTVTCQRTRIFELSEPFTWDSILEDTHRPNEALSSQMPMLPGLATFLDNLGTVYAKHSSFNADLPTYLRA